MRPIWKGHITFGLVNIPVTLYSAQKGYELHFNLLDSRDQSHIRYQRINEMTGKEVPWEEVVKAYEYEDGRYVVLKDEDFKRAAVEGTQAVEIQNFIKGSDLDCVYFEKPYYLVPDKKGEKGYALLREALRRTKTVGIAKVVIRTRQYLAAIFPYDKALLLDLLRFPQELRNPNEFELPKDNMKEYKISEKEIGLAEQLIASMLSKWNPKKYHDDYREALMKWINRKAKLGEAVEVEEIEEEEKPKTAKVIDFMELLKKSVKAKERKQRSKKSRSRVKSKKAKRA